jgi:nitrite reductase/ring-hydroxylating ferredoxin subunit
MTSHDEESNIPRRTFCNRLLLTSAGLALAASDLKGQPEGQHGTSLFYPPVKIEGAERVLPGSFLYFNYPRANDPAVLVRGQDGEYLAYSRKCAHLGCSVDFDSARRCLGCPCHRGVYDARTGYVVYGPPRDPSIKLCCRCARAVNSGPSAGGRAAILTLCSPTLNGATDNRECLRRSESSSLFRR